MTCRHQQAVVLAVVATLACVGTTHAAEPAASTDVQAEIQALKRETQALKAEIGELKRKENQDWMTAERTNQIKAIVNECLADATTRGAGPDGNIQAGYKNGFFIQSSDHNFSLKVNGFIQIRYTFAHDEYRTAATPKSAVDVNGFDFRRARLIFSGNAFTPDLTFNVTGDFAGDAKNVFATNSNSTSFLPGAGTTAVPTDQNFLQIVDLYAAYHFTDLLQVRVGAFLTPFSRAEYLVAGLEFADLDPVVAPFDPQRSLGVSLYGFPIEDQLSYELNINNGQNSNKLGRAAEQGSGSNDNRLAFYGRTQYASSKLADFADEPDLRKDTSAFAWQIGAAAGYESANATTTAMPSAQGGATIGGNSTLPSSGFVNSYQLNGDLFRGTVDFAAKYQGFSFTTAAYIQQINENQGTFLSSSTGTTGSPGIAVTKDASFFQAGYYGQVGYMLTKKWEVVGRVGQLLTEGGPNRMEEYAVGLNYYVYGQNVKIQGDVTYIPNEAGFTSSTYSTLVNTQDLIGRVQLQTKF